MTKQNGEEREEDKGEMLPLVEATAEPDNKDKLIECVSRVSGREEAVEGSDSEPDIDEIETDLKMDRIFPLNFIEDIMGTGSKKIKSKRRLNKKIKKSNTGEPTVLLDHPSPSSKLIATHNESSNTNIR